MRRVVAVAVLALFVTTPALSAELTPFMEEEKLGAYIQDLRFPGTLRKDLTSGLTNRVLIRIVALAQSRQVAQKAVEIAVKYDLWEETFRFTIAVEGVVAVERTLPGIDATLSLLANPRLPGLFTPRELPAGETIALHAQLLLNPIDRERMEKIRKWVAENSTQTRTPSDPTGLGPLGASTSNTIFNRIFEQYAAGTDLSAAWSASAASKPFRLEDVRRDGK